MQDRPALLMLTAYPLSGMLNLIWSVKDGDIIEWGKITRVAEERLSCHLYQSQFALNTLCPSSQLTLGLFL